MRSPNPIYDHLTRHRRAPSVHFTMILGVLFSLVLTSANLAFVWYALQPSTVTSSGVPPVSWIVIVMGILVFATSPIISSAVTATHTHRASSDEGFVLLKLTGFPNHTLIMAFLYAAIFRLRMLWMVAYGLLPPLFVSIAGLYVMLDRAFSDGQVSVLDSAWAGAPSAAMIVISGAVIGSAVNWLALCSGVWLGLKLRSMGSVLGAALAFGIAELILAILTSYAIVDVINVLGVGGALIGLLIFGATAYLLGNHIIERAEGLL